MKCCKVKQKHNLFLVCSDLEQGKCENMVNFMLYISADLENLTNFQPAGGVDDPNFTYYFKVFSFFIFMEFRIMYHRFFVTRVS